jgi:hypothetical protein
VRNGLSYHWAEILGLQGGQVNEGGSVGGVSRRNWREIHWLLKNVSFSRNRFKISGPDYSLLIMKSEMVGKRRQECRKYLWVRSPKSGRGASWGLRLQNWLRATE